MIGKTLSQYEILEKLGEGGMGVVYKARQMSLDRFVALKTLHTSLGSAPSFVKRFRRKAHAVTRLGHPNVVQIYDIAEEVELQFFSMEFSMRGIFI